MTTKAKSDLLSFSDEESIAASGRGGARWKILIVDDEEEVHAVTKLALSDFEFAGRGLLLLSAYSAAEAERMLSLHVDIALILLDVVMETEDSGLELVRHVRDVLSNRFVRIVLRTGQPGQAPERRVVTEYDINDYKEKTELTSQKLFTTVYTALSAYRALVGLDANRRGLVKVIEASASIFERQSLSQFTEGVLEQVAALLFFDQEVVLVKSIGIASDSYYTHQEILAAGQTDRDYLGQDPRVVLPAAVNERIQRAFREQQSQIEEEYFAGYLETRTGLRAVIYVAGASPIRPPDQNLLELFFRNITVGLENLYLRQDIDASQEEMVYLLGDAVESRCGETGNHVRRVAEYARELALLHGMDQRDAEILRAAAPLHDVGKIATPDAILKSPHKLSPQEWEIMKQHTLEGARVLSTSMRPVLQAAAIVAAQHHENWDGTGYPSQLAGEDIHIYGRIVALADVLDALGSERCYKKAWELNQIIDFLREQSGRKFDPALTALLLDNLPLFSEIRRRFPDEQQGTC